MTLNMSINKNKNKKDQELWEREPAAWEGLLKDPAIMCLYLWFTVRIK